MASTREGANARLDKAALFRLLGYVPHAGQALVHASAARIRVVAAGSRWGKSRCAVMETLAAALAPGPAARMWIAAPRFEVTDMLLERLQAQLRGGLAHRLLEVDRRARRIVISNLAGSLAVIEGRCTTNVASLLGESVAFLLVDESGRVDDAAWESALAARLVERDGRALVVGTPREEGSWFHKLFLAGQERSGDIESWSGKSIENPAIDAALVERERERLSVSEFASEFEGLFVGPNGPRCLTCGGPPTGCRSVLVLLDGEELAHCAACQRPLDRDGNPVGQVVNGVLQLTTIRHDPIDPPEGE
jgi:hypothetical protein